MIDKSDASLLEQLQEKLLALNEKNFEDTKRILNSIFVISKEAVHVIICTFYQVSAVRLNDYKSLIFVIINDHLIL